MTAKDLLKAISGEMELSIETRWSIPSKGCIQPMFHSQMYGHTLYVREVLTGSLFEVMVCDSTIARWQDLGLISPEGTI